MGYDVQGVIWEKEDEAKKVRLLVLPKKLSLSNWQLGYLRNGATKRWPIIDYRRIAVVITYDCHIAGSVIPFLSSLKSFQI